MAEQSLENHLAANYDQDDYDNVLRDPGIFYPDLEAAIWTDHEISEYFALEKILSALNKLPRLYHDSADTGLQVSVKASRYFDADGTERTPVVSNAQAITLSQTNYLYLTNTGTLTINTTGFPDPTTTPHIRIATIAAGATSWNPTTNVVDYLSENLLRPLGTIEHQLQTRAQVLVGPFTVANIAASQTNSDLSYGGDVQGVPMPRAGYIVSASIRLNDARTAGTCTLKPTINGTELTQTGLNLVINGTDTQQDVASVAWAVHANYAFALGDRLGISYTTDGSWTPDGTPDGVANLFVVFDPD